MIIIRILVSLLFSGKMFCILSLSIMFAIHFGVDFVNYIHLISVFLELVSWMSVDFYQIIFSVSIEIILYIFNLFMW